MYQYAKKILKETMEKEYLRKEEINQKQKENNEKMKYINRYEELSKITKRNKRRFFFAISILIMLGIFLIGLGIINQTSFLRIAVATLSAEAYFGLMISDRVSGYIKTKREFQLLSEEEYNELKENGENLTELSNKLEREYTNIETVINKLKINLDMIKILEEIQKENLMDKPFYKADTEEEYELLTHGHVENYLEEYLNEPINYPSIHLEVNQVNKGKSLIKKY